MATHVSAPVREHTPHPNQTTRIATTFDISPTTQADEDNPNDNGAGRQKIEALAEIICSAGDEYAGALFVLMGALENSANPEVLAHTVKHLAFTRCGEFNLFGMVDAQIDIVEGELLAHASKTCF